MNVFEVLDFRMLSGLVGRSWSPRLARHFKTLVKNPSIDGYPDLLNAVTKDQIRTIDTARRPKRRIFQLIPVRWPRNQKHVWDEEEAKGWP